MNSPLETSKQRLRFWAKVERRGSDDCWLWIGARANGYGLFRLDTQRRASAHRISYAHHCGPIPDGLWVLHDCDTPLCVNPRHLHLGTHRDNMREAVERGRQAVGERAANSKLTADDVREIRRRCRKRGEGGERQDDVAEEFGISRNHIWMIIHRRAWKHLS